MLNPLFKIILMSLRLTHQVVQQIESDLRNGVSQRDIMKEHHVGSKTIKMIAVAAGINVKHGRKVTQITQEEIDFVVKYRNDFHVGIHRTTQAAIARGISTTERNVRRIFEKKISIALSSKRLKKNTRGDSMQSMLDNFGILICII